MTINTHKTSYAGYPVQQWNSGPLKAAIAYRISNEFNDKESWPEKFKRFTGTAGSDQVQAIIVGGAWDKDAIFQTIEVFTNALIEERTALPNVHALFIPDVTFEENEISWINQTDVSSLLAAYPQLEHFGTRGSNDLRFSHLHHAMLRSWVIETGGITRELLDEIKQADVPQLIDFEVWTGSSRYGWDGTLDDLLPIIRGEVFPHLKRLGICNCEIADEVAQALVESPLMERLESLDLSRGLLGDEGAKALLSHPAVHRLKALDVRHHFCTPPIEALLYGLMGDGVKVQIDTAQNERDWDDDESRYVAVGE